MVRAKDSRESLCENYHKFITRKYQQGIKELTCYLISCEISTRSKREEK